jgi:FtsH-binding integral membrane protein
LDIRLVVSQPARRDPRGIVRGVIAALPDASTWETECFISAAVAGVTGIAVVSASIARRSTATPARRVLITGIVAILFVAVLAFVFSSVDPCAQGPA